MKYIQKILITMLVFVCLSQFLTAFAGNQAVDTIGDVGQYSSLVLDSNGYPVISYRDVTSGHLKVAHCNDPICSGNDESLQTVDNAIIGGLHTSIVLDSDGNPVISYYDATNGNLKVAHCNDVNCNGGNESLQTVDTPGDIGHYTSIVLDANGFPVISYYRVTGGGSIRIVHCNDVDCSGGNEFVSVLAFGGVGEYTAIALDANGFPIVSYYDATNGDLIVAHCNDVNCLGGDESLQTVDSVGNVGSYTSLILDGNGYPIISYYDVSNGHLKVAHCNDSDCSGNDESLQTVDSVGDVGQYTSLALNNNGYPVISYFNITNSNLKVAYCNDPNCSGNDERLQTMDFGANTGRYTSLVLDSNDNPIVSYYDGGDDDLVLHYGTTYEFDSLTYSQIEGSGSGVTDAVVTITRTGDITSVETIDIQLAPNTATATDDYDPIAITVSFFANEITKSVSVPIVADDLIEGDEQLTLTLVNPNNLGWISLTKGEATLTIQDDDVLIEPSPTPSPTPASSSTITGVTVFDPSISKVGVLQPGKVGVTGEQVEWIVSVTNVSGVTGNNVVVSDTIDSRMTIDNVVAPGGDVIVNGQRVTVTYSNLFPGQAVNFSIFTTVLDGLFVTNTACVNADNQGAEECASANALGVGLPSNLPKTGASPWAVLRLPLMIFCGLLGLALVRRKRVI